VGPDNAGGQKRSVAAARSLPRATGRHYAGRGGRDQRSTVMLAACASPLSLPYRYRNFTALLGLRLPRLAYSMPEVGMDGAWGSWCQAPLPLAFGCSMLPLPRAAHAWRKIATEAH